MYRCCKCKQPFGYSALFNASPAFPYACPSCGTQQHPPRTSAQWGVAASLVLAALLVATYYAGLPFEVGVLTFLAAMVAAILLDHRRGVTIPTSPAQKVSYRIGMAFVATLIGVPLLLVLFDVKL